MTHTEKQAMTTMTASNAQCRPRGSLPAVLQQLLPRHSASPAVRSQHAAYCWWRSLLHRGWADSTAKSSALETTPETHKTIQSI